jgi:hypothetical protein
MTARAETATQLVVQVEPIEIALRSRDRIEYFFDASPETLIEWHNGWGFPIRWEGQGRGRKGYVPVREARIALRKRLMVGAA